MTSESPLQPKLFYDSMSLTYALRSYLRDLCNSACFPLVESLHLAITISQVNETDRSPEETIEELSVKHGFNANEILESVPNGE